MTDTIKKLLDRYIVKGEQKKFRQPTQDKYAQAVIYSAEGLTDIRRAVKRLRYVLESERPAVWPDDNIALIRTVTTLPEIFTEKEWAELRAKYTVHEQGKVFNISPEYGLLLSKGFRAAREDINARLAGETCGEKREFLTALMETLDILSAFAARYQAEAQRVGNETVFAAFSRIPEEKPETLLEALQFLRLLHYGLWASFNYHNTLGRFDQTMRPFFESDIASGRLTKEGALELIEEFFISCNKDSDLYTGIQQGDNGQSLVLGGLNPDGTDSFSIFSELCLQASLELKLIDPKINLRVNKKTPLRLYERGTQLTRQGLGFPQYCNDDIVIECLKRWGYDEADAYNYSVAACWEFIVPGWGMDIPNIGGLSFPASVLDAMPELESCQSFEDFARKVDGNVAAQANRLIDAIGELYMEPAPLMSLMMHGCVENARDISKGGKYNNFGFHGVGISTAADSLAAIKKYIFKDKSVTAQKLNLALRDNFIGHEALRNKLRFEAPKMGNDDDRADNMACRLLGDFADALEGKKNSRGGIFRGGTGSAMYYVWHARSATATPDGRSAEEDFACNYSPSLFSRCDGPVSIIKSFTKPDLTRVCNGGPLTMELHDTVFRNEESVSKVAAFVKSFIDMGGHQLQINAVNREKLLKAKKHPENYRNLIVRVWGWSGYFVELDEVYQDHIIKRAELTLE